MFCQILKKALLGLFGSVLFIPALSAEPQLKSFVRLKEEAPDFTQTPTPDQLRLLNDYNMFGS